MQAFQKSICPRTQLQFDCEQWCKRLGQNCQVCSNSLTHQRCISLCKCYYFCHQSCFMSAFQKQIKDEEIQIRCNRCSEVLKINLDATYKYSPQKSYAKIGKIAIIGLLLIINILGIALTLNATLSHAALYFLLYFQGLVLSLLLYFLVISLRDILYIKIVQIKEIVSTKLEIQTSAFKDLELQTNEQLTKDELIFDSKKEKN